jgi:hypothetical protein
MSEPWLENPESLDAQIALMREMQKARLVAAGGDCSDPTLRCVTAIILRLMEAQDVAALSHGADEELLVQKTLEMYRLSPPAVRHAMMDAVERVIAHGNS